MTTQTDTTPTHSLKTLSARRQEAEAQIRALDAQRDATLAQAEAEAAEQEVARRQAQARHAQHRAELDDLDRYVDEQHQRERQEWSRAYDKRQETMQQLRAFANEKPAPVPMSAEDRRAALAGLDRYCDAAQQAQEDRLYRECDAWESQACIDPAYKRRMAITHPGGADNCPCAHHEAWRKHWPR